MAQAVATPLFAIGITLIIWTMVICNTSVTGILRNTSSKWAKRIPIDARLSTGPVGMNQLIGTARTAAMRRFRTATTLTTWLVGACIIRMGITAMITALCRWFRIEVKSAFPARPTSAM